MNKWKQILKKHRIKIVLAGLAGIIVIIDLVWNLWYNRDMPYKSLELDEENVKCIVVVNKTKRKTWTVTDENKIDEILKYFNGLKVREFNTYEKHILFDLHIPQGETLLINSQPRIVQQKEKSIYNELGSLFKDEADEGNDE